MKVQRGVWRGVWPGLIGLFLSLLVSGEAGAYTSAKVGVNLSDFALVPNRHRSINAEMRVSNQAIAAENSKDKAAPLGPAIEVRPEVKAGLEPPQRTTLEPFKLQKRQAAPKPGILDKVKPKFVDQGVEVLIRLE